MIKYTNRLVCGVIYNASCCVTGGRKWFTTTLIEKSVRFVVRHKAIGMIITKLDAQNLVV